MKADVELDPPATLFAFADEGVAPEVRSMDAGDVESRLGYTRSGEAFFIQGDDPIPGRFQFYVEEPVPEEIEDVYTPVISIDLRLPSGQLSVSALGDGSTETAERPESRTLEVAPGDYAVSVLRRDVVASDADWRLYDRVNHFGAAGCLFLGLGMLFVLFPYTRREYWYLLPMFLLPTCAFIFLRRLPGYARISEQIREQQADQSRHVISMQRVVAAGSESPG